MIERYKYKSIWNYLKDSRQMVFIAGPRQTGKTTFAKQIAKNYRNALYFNWDIIEDRQLLLKNPSFYENMDRKDLTKPLVILDEIHKYSKCKSFLKSIYDKNSNDYKFIVSGSGRLDIFQKGGDSLTGRYFLMHVLPFTLAEIINTKREMPSFLNNPLEISNESNHTLEVWNRLQNFGGFPDPYISENKAFFNRWSRSYAQQLIYEDIRSILQLQLLDHLELLYTLLPSKIGSPLSINGLSRDMQVTFNTAKNWLSIFERFYFVFSISPWFKRITRTVLKEKKFYLFNYAIIDNPAAKFENMVALELLRAISNWNDIGLGDFKLCFLRNKDGQEVDFLIANKSKPLLLIETKLSEEAPSANIVKFQNMLNIPAIQLVNKKGICKIVKNNKEKILVVSASRWLPELP